MICTFPTNKTGRASQITVERKPYLKPIEGSEREWCGRAVFIRHGPRGSFLRPPGHPTYRYSYCAGPVQGFGFQEHGSIEYLYRTARRNGLKRIVRAVKPYMNYDPPALDDEMAQAWVEAVYSYFQNCYSPDGVDRDSNHSIVDVKDELPPENHLAYLQIKQYYPDYVPNLEKIKSPIDITKLGKKGLRHALGYKEGEKK